MVTHLLLIDPQHDFCDLPADAWPPGAAPALPVPGADADLRRVAALMDATAGALGAATVTLDTHQRVDIAHPAFWRQGDGRDVPPFTPLSAAESQCVRATVEHPADHLSPARRGAP